MKQDVQQSDERHLRHSALHLLARGETLGGTCSHLRTLAVNCDTVRVAGSPRNSFPSPRKHQGPSERVKVGGRLRSRC